MHNLKLQFVICIVASVSNKLTHYCSSDNKLLLLYGVGFQKDCTEG